MSDPVTIGAAIGAGGGVLMNKKDPLKGALMGAGLGATGGYFAPAMGLGGAAGAAEGAGMDAIGHFAAAEAAGAPISMSEASLMAGPMNPANATPFAATPMGAYLKNPLLPLGANMMMSGMGGGQQMPMQAPMPMMPQRMPFQPGSIAGTSPFVSPTRPYSPSRGWRG